MKTSYIGQYNNSYIGLYKNVYKTLGDLAYIDLFFDKDYHLFLKGNRDCLRYSSKQNKFKIQLSH